MERVVGVALLILGAWVFSNARPVPAGEQDFGLKSRRMLVFAAVRHGFGRMPACFTPR